MSIRTQKTIGYISLPILYFGAGFGSYLCAMRHVCREGHMSHPPYPLGEYVLDAAWSLAFIAIPIISWRLLLFGRFWWLTLIVVGFPFWRFYNGCISDIQLLGFQL
jgi:hypothetical protein